MAEKRQMLEDVCRSAKYRKAAFLTPREYMSRFQDLIQHGPPKPTAAALAQAEQRTRFQLTLLADATRAANARLRDPLRVRFDRGSSMEVDEVARPCSKCSLRVETAFTTASGKCADCRMDLCAACLRAHTTTRHRPVASDESTADNSDGGNSDSDNWDIPVE